MRWAGSMQQMCLRAREVDADVPWQRDVMSGDAGELQDVAAERGATGATQH